MKKALLLILIFISTYNLSGQIIYTEVTPDDDYRCVPSYKGSYDYFYDLDINNDGIKDFKFSYSSSSDQYTTREYRGVSSYNNNKVADFDQLCPSYNPVTLCYPYNIGDTIDSNLFWRQSGTFYSYYHLTGGSTFTCFLSYGFLGIQLTVDTNTYYGWIQVNPGFYPSVFNAYAYELSLNYIIAGQIPAGFGIRDNIKNELKVSPNPFSLSTQINLNQTYQNIALAVYDIQGKLVAQQHYTNCSQIQLHRNQLTNGMYFVKLTLDDKQVETVKMVVGE